MRIHLIHGFNVSDGGAGTVGNLQATYEGMGHTVIRHNLGMIGLFSLDSQNAKAVAHLLQHVSPGDVLVGHSNGVLICWLMIQQGYRPEAVICFQPSIRRDTKWPAGVPVLCIYNPFDWVVQLGRWWGRLTKRGRLAPNGWGAAGRYGFTAVNHCVTNWNTSAAYWDFPTRGHSAVLRMPAAAYWAKLSAEWLERRGIGEALVTKGETLV